jgi:hypothetical protein
MFFTRLLALIQSSFTFRVKFIFWCLSPFWIKLFYVFSILFLAMQGVPYEVLKNLCENPDCF